MTTLPKVGQEPALAAGEPDDLEPLWSVTTLIGCLDKPALVPWAVNETARAAIDDVAVWMARLEHEGRDSALQYLKNARFRRGRGKRSATELGTAIHAACEYVALNGNFRHEDWHDDELRPFLAQYDRFLDEWQPEFIASEVTVFSPSFGYAGTCDGFMAL